MALQGTLKDFGIADILQLIGQQQKTGVLWLRGPKREIKVSFRDGSIVRAETTTRKKMDLIGAMLVRSELLTQYALESALETQRRTLRRLGDILVEDGLVTRERFQAMIELQTRETLNDLFQWTDGRYEFHQEPLEDIETTVPMRAEAILMDGFRIVDEWPVVRKTITSYELTFKVLQPLPEPKPRADEEEGGSEFRNIGKSERLVFELLKPERDVRKLIDLSCLGEFETCKALFNLVTLGHLEVVQPAGRLHAVGGASTSLQQLLPLLGQGLSAAVLLVLLSFAVSRVRVEGVGLAGPPESSYADPAVQRFATLAQLARIRAALDVYRLEKGDLPPALYVLVDTGLLSKSDLQYPWREPYYYRRASGSDFILLPPLR